MNRIRKIRLQRNITQIKLAETLGVTQGVISSWETGRNKPALGTARKLAKALGCTIEELFEREDEAAREGGEDERF